MSDSSEKTSKPKGKVKGLLVKVLGGVALLGAGAGGVFGLLQAGIIGSHAEAKEEDRPKLIRKGEEDPYAPKAKEGEEEGAGETVYGEGGSEYRTAYYTFDGEFTSNLKGTDALIQVSLAASTRRDGRVLMWMKEHELAVRSGLLAVLADTMEEEITTIEGKERLQKRLTAAINKVLTEEEGFGGVDGVFFRNFIIQ
jgi:flagellar FliL protein